MYHFRPMVKQLPDFTDVLNSEPTWTRYCVLEALGGYRGTGACYMTLQCVFSSSHKMPWTTEHVSLCTILSSIAPLFKVVAADQLPQLPINS